MKYNHLENIFWIIFSGVFILITIFSLPNNFSTQDYGVAWIFSTSLVGSIMCGRGVAVLITIVVKIIRNDFFPL